MPLALHKVPLSQRVLEAPGTVPPQHQQCLYSRRGLEGEAVVVLVGHVGQGLPYGVGMGVPGT